MAKRSSDNEESESKKLCQEAVEPGPYSRMFFAGEQADDVFAIHKKWWGGASPLEIYFKTKELAEEFLERIKARDKADADQYSVVKMRRAEGSDQLLCDALICKRDPRPE